MTDQPKSTQLSPEEWKQLCLLNLAQLQPHLQGLPPVLEGGASAMTPEQLTAVETHLTRLRSFLGAWARAKPIQETQAAAPMPKVNQAALADVLTNGAAPPLYPPDGPPRQKRKYTKRAKSDQAVA